MIVQTRGEHEEKPTTRRLQVISNVNHNNNNNQNNNNRNNNKQNNNNQNNNNQNNNNQNNNNNNHKRRKVEKMQKQKPNKKSSSSQEERERGGSEREEQEKQIDEKNVEKDESSRGFAVATTITTTTNTTRETQSMSRHKQNTNHSNNNNNNNNNNMQQTKNFDTNNNNHNNYSSNNNNNNNSKLRHIHQSSRQLENTSNHDQQQQQQQQLQQHHGRHHQFRKRKKKLHNKPKDQQQQQQQEQHHVQTDIVQTNGNGGFNNATTTTTTKMTTVTMSGSGSGSSTATTTTTTTTLDSIRANSATSGEEPHSLNRGSDFATSSSSSSSSGAAATTTSSSSSLMSGGVRSLSSPGRGESSDVVAGIDGVDPGSDVGAADDVEVGRSNSRSYVNSDDLAFDDRIYDKFNLHGIPSQQQGVTHFEKIHSSHHPVCGTDGRTYNTECQLKKRACRTDNADLVVAYHGHCRTSCSGVKCVNGLTCVEDQYTIPNCIACQIACPLDDRHEAEGLAVDESRAVCGVDGQTYRSVCAINRMICRIGRSIGVAYPGPCRDDRVTCADINCGPKRTCLMDLLTHEPRCVSCRYKCSRKRRPGAVRYEEGRICGVNNRTYNSWCEMRKDSCSTGFFIDVKSLGDCQ